MNKKTPDFEKSAAYQKMQHDDEIKTANTALFAGAGLGAYTSLTAVTSSFICPVCIVAAPALIGYGLYKRVKTKSERQKLDNTHESMNTSETAAE